jgi:hypothetical protein
LTLVLKINLGENIVKYFEINFGHLKCPDDADVVWSRRQRKSRLQRNTQLNAGSACGQVLKHHFAVPSAQDEAAQDQTDTHT